ncbi:polysaccharide pyruvyl transferase CsaB [bacterium]|nr:polysaccharide pyruvyl transferase CsaB [bacterium]
MKKVLVSGYIGFNNFGDEAIFYVLSTHLKNLGFDISVLCGNIQETQKKYEVKTYKYKSLVQILKAVLGCDILISGGGSLLQNKTSNFSLFYYLFIIFLAKICFKKVIIFAQGFEKISGIIPEYITKFILKTVNFISVRDEKSKNYLKKLNIDSILVSDPAYSLVQDMKPFDDKQGLIVQLREFKGIDDNFISTLADIVAKKYQGKVSVFSFQDEIDEKKCLKFVEEMKKNNVQAEYICEKSIDKTIQILNEAKYVISTRLHGLIISNALKTKTFAIAYDEKNKTLCKELNIQNIDILNYTDNELDNKLDEFFNHCLNEVHPYRRFEWDCIDNELNKN